MQRFSLRFLICIGALYLTASCTDSGLATPEGGDGVYKDDKLKLSGRVCTSDPTDVTFPLKVLFVIDTSQSMNKSDPISQTNPDPLEQTGRVRAIARVINEYVKLKASFITTRCNTGATGCTKGSTSCPACPSASKHLCVGPQCCNDTLAMCKGVPPCQPQNGTCASLCSAAADCASLGGGQCVNGVCVANLDPGVEFAIMRFGSAKDVLTRNRAGQFGFTNDPRELLTALPNVSNGGSVTDYEGALATAYETISTDITRMKQQHAAALSRTKYMVIFLSDGKPDPQINDEDDWKNVPCYAQGLLMNVTLSDPNNCDTNSTDMATLAAYRQAIQEYNLPGRVLIRVKEIVALKALHRLGGVALHTAYLAGVESSSVEDQSKNLLTQMAQLGQGTFRSFADGQSINFLKIGFSSLRRVFTLKSLIVSNENARPVPTLGVARVDSDGDGLHDGLEALHGSNKRLVDTDQDGFSDTLEHFYRSSGWDVLDPADADCPLLADKDGDGRPDDSDGDGLLDCEERFLGTNRTLFDSDGDGIPDRLEVQFGTNPVVDDASDDQLDFDGMPNGDEIRFHTDPRIRDAAHRSHNSYRYKVQRDGVGIERAGLRCTLATDCPSGADCAEGYCRCFNAAGCASGASCNVDADCAVSGEACKAGSCTGSWSCAPLPGLSQPEQVCSKVKHITCYSYEVENITLVTPVAPGAGASSAAQSGWNTIRLYFGETPFDSPGDPGRYQVACVKVNYDRPQDLKRPATGKLTVPLTAWIDPKEASRTYVATALTKAPAGAVVCGSAGGSKAYCRAGDRCLDAVKARCQVEACIVAR
jgi:hypothetical protein